MNSKSSSRITRVFSLLIIVSLTLSSMIVIVPWMTPLEIGTGELTEKPARVTADFTPPEPLWIRAYNGLPDSDNKLEDVIQCSDGDFAATGGQIDSHGGQPECWDWFTILTDDEGGGTDDGQDWTDYYGGNDCDRALSIVEESSSGDLVVAGYYVGNGRDIRLRRLTSSGSEVWTRIYTEPYDQLAYDIIPCSGGGFAVAGRYSFGDGLPTDFFLLRTLDNGYESWRYSFYGASWEEATAVVETSDGGFVMAGYTNTYGGSDRDLLLVKVDSDGDYVWDSVIGGDFDDWGEQIIECSDGGFAIVGSTKSYGGSDQDMWLVKADSTGQEEWVQYFGGSNTDWGKSLIECDDGGFALTGTTESFGSGGGDVYLVRTNSTGHELWSNQYGGTNADSGNAIVKCQDGGFVIGGGSHNWGGGDEDGFLLKVADPPVWLIEPPDQEVVFGDVFSYDLQVAATYIDTWWLNDTVKFAVDVNGRVSSTSILSVGTYGLQVWVNDTLGNELTGEFNVAVVYSPAVNTRDPLWQRTYGGSAEDRGSQIIRCDSGGFAIAGYGASFGGVGMDGWLARCDEFGNLLWNQTFGGSGTDRFHSLAECSNGDFIICGATTSFGGAFYDAWLVRTDFEGNELWSQPFGGSYADYANSVVESSDGETVITGYTSDSDTVRDLWLFKVNSTGSLNWSTDVDFANDQEGFCVLEDSNGGFAIAGYNETGAGSTTRDGVLLRADVDGNVLWTSLFGTAARDEYWSIVECADNDYAMTGFTDQLGHQDVWFVRCNSDGSSPVSQTYGTTSDDYGVSLIECYNESFAIIAVRGDVGNGQDALLIRTQSNGNLLWSEALGGSDDDHGTSIVECSDGGYVIAGSTQSMGAGNFDVWLYRVQPVQWVALPEDQYTEYNWGINYTLQVKTTSATLNSWTPNHADFDLTESSGDLFLTNNTKVAEGAYILNIYMDDNFGDFLNTTLTVTVEADMPPAWIVTPTDQYVEYGDEFVYRLYARDTVGIDTWKLNDTSFSISSIGTINATLTPVGIYGLEITVNDSLGLETSEEITVTVADTTPPAWNIEPVDQYVQWGGFFNYTVEAWDVSELDYWWLNDTTHVNVTQTGSIVQLHTIPVGVQRLLVSVNDTEGNIQSADFMITVSIDGPYWVTEPSNHFAEYAHEYRHILMAYAPASIHTWWLNDTTFFDIDEFGIITNATALEVGSYGLQVYLNDTWDQTLGAEFTITVRDSIAPMWVETPSDRTVEQGYPLSFIMAATDASGVSHWAINDTVSFAVTSNGRVMNITSLAPGMYGLTVTVFDVNGNGRAAEFSVTVTDSGVPVWLETPTDQRVEFGDDFMYALSAYDPSGIGEWLLNNTVQFDISDDGVITNTMSLPVDRYTLIVWVSDTIGNTASVLFTVIVSDTTPPVWVVAPTNQGVEYGGSIRMQLRARDPSRIDRWAVDDTVQFHISDTGLFESTDELDVGVHTVNITVYDTYGNGLTGTITVIVTAGEAGGLSFTLAGAIVGAVTLGVVVMLVLIVIIVRRREGALGVVSMPSRALGRRMKVNSISKRRGCLG